MYARILVPLDGSPLSEAVVPWLLPLAAKLHAQVFLLQAIAPSPAEPYVPATVYGAASAYVPSVEEEHQWIEQARAYLRQIAARFPPEAEVRCLVRFGEAAPAIIRGAKECGADLIAMSTHGHTGLARLVFGSVAEAVVRGAGMPVLVVRPDESALNAVGA